MDTNSIVVLVLILYAAAMVVMGAHFKRSADRGSVRESVLGRGKASFWVLLGSGVGMQVGSGFVIGGAEYGAIYGISGAWYGIGCGLSYIAAALLICRLVYRNGFVSLADYFERRYQGVAIRLIYNVITTLSAIAMMAGQLLAGRAIFQVVGLPSRMGGIVTAVISLVYTVSTGMLGTMAMGALQSAVILAGIVAALASTAGEFGFAFLRENLPAASFSPMPFDLEFLVSLTVPTILCALVQQGMIQRVSSGKSERTSFFSCLYGGILVLPIALIPPLLGMFGTVFFPELPASSVMIQLLLVKLPVVIGAVILAAVICAVVGACNAVYISTATVILHDVYHGILRCEEDSGRDRKIVMLADLVVCLIGIFLALAMDDIIQVLMMGYILVSSGCIVPFFGGLIWKHGSTQGALVSMCAGILAAVLDMADLIHLPYLSITSVLISAVFFIAASLAFPEKN